jgi:hypothetical protein
MVTIDDMTAYLSSIYPNTEESARRILENTFPNETPADRAEAARRHAVKEGLGPQG